jgi:hypothetical protein
MLRRLLLLGSVWLLAAGCGSRSQIFDSSGGGSGSSSGSSLTDDSGSSGSTSSGSDASIIPDAAPPEEVGCGSACPDTCTNPPCLVKLAPGPVYDLAIDHTRVYWTSFDATNPAAPGSVVKVPLDGGVATTLASNLLGPMLLALSATDVYWTSGYETTGGIMMVSLAGGTPTLFAPAEYATGGVACDGRNVYWTEWYSVESTPVAAGGSSVLAEWPGQFFPGAVAVDARSAYSVSSMGHPGTTVVGSVPIAGGTSTMLASGQHAVWVAVDSANVYWTNDGAPSGSVRRVPIGGGPVTTLADDQDGPSSIAVDGANVYWTNSNGGTVMRVATSGGALTTLASGLTHPSGIAVDATSVYWGTHDAVMKLTPK